MFFVVYKLIVYIFALMEQVNLIIKQLRKEKGLSQFDVANRLGISQTAYASIESGKTKSISVEIGKGLAEVLDQDFNILFGVERKENDQTKLIENLKKEIETLKEQLEDKKNIVAFFQKERSSIKYIILSWYLKNFDIKQLNLILRRGKGKLTEQEFNKEVVEIKKRAMDFLSVFIINGLIDEKDMDDYFDRIYTRLKIDLGASYDFKDDFPEMFEL